MSLSKNLVSQLRRLGFHERRLSVRSNVLAKSDFIIKSPLEDIEIKIPNLYERMWRDVSHWTHKLAIECAVTRKRYTYSELLSHIDRFGSALTRLQLPHQSVLAIMLPNQPEFPVAAFGAVRAGFRVTTINPAYKQYEITKQLKLTKPKIIVTNKDCYQTVLKALQTVQVDAKIIIVDRDNESIPEGTLRFSEIETMDIDRAVLDKVESRLDDVAFLPFSSGTTGLPKGVEISHRNLVAGLEMVSHDEVRLPDPSFGSFQDVVPCVLPFFHIYGLVVTLTGHLANGCKLISLPRFTPDLYLDVLKRDRATLLYVVPPMAIFLGKSELVTRDHLASARRLLSGAAPLATTDIEPIAEKTNGQLQFFQGYGATETTSLGTVTLKSGPRDMSTVGEPVSSVEMQIVHLQTGEPIPFGQEGEILFRGPHVMRGYFENEEATRDVFAPGGFYRTGDLGVYKPGSGLVVTDRLKELIKVKGMQVAPAELEALLRTHPSVQDAGVVGVPHPVSGEVPAAFLVLKDDTKLSEEEVQEWVAGQVASYKQIQQVVFTDSLPKTASGKILRRELKERATKQATS